MRANFASWITGIFLVGLVSGQLPFGGQPSGIIPSTKTNPFAIVHPAAPDPFKAFVSAILGKVPDDNPNVFKAPPNHDIFQAPLNSYNSQQPQNANPYAVNPFHPPPDINPAAFHAPPAINPAAFHARPDINPAAFYAPTDINPAAFHAPTDINPAAFHAPTDINPAAFHTPTDINPAVFHAPPDINPAAFHTPPDTNPAAFHTPPDINPAAFHALFPPPLHPFVLNPHDMPPANPLSANNFGAPIHDDHLAPPSYNPFTNSDFPSFIPPGPDNSQPKLEIRPANYPAQDVDASSDNEQVAQMQQDSRSQQQSVIKTTTTETISIGKEPEEILVKKQNKRKKKTKKDVKKDHKESSNTTTTEASLDYMQPPDVPNEYPDFKFPEGFFHEVLSALSTESATEITQEYITNYDEEIGRTTKTFPEQKTVETAGDSAFTVSESTANPEDVELGSETTSFEAEKTEEATDNISDICGKDEEWWPCKPLLHNTCENFARAEARRDFVCEPGCFCMDGLIKTNDGRCVEPEDCPDPVCGDNEEDTDCMNPCNTCEAECKKRCSMLFCRPGCDCRDSYKRDGNGTCVHVSQCPSCSATST